MIPKSNIPRFLSKFLKQPIYAVKVALKRFKAYKYFKSKDGIAPFPESITFFLTHRCNLRCKMCGQWGESGVTKKSLELREQSLKEIGIEEWMRIIEDISSFKPNITLFGGEPLLYRYTTDLIKELKRKNFHVLMITNGSMLKNFAKELVDYRIDEINLSLDGDEKLHDEIRGLPGLFNRIREGILEVQKLKKKYKKKKPLINLQCTITKWNYKHLEKLIEVVNALKVNSLTFHNLIFLSNEIYEKQERSFQNDFGCGSFEWKGFIFSPDIDVEILIKKINEIKKMRKSFPVDFYPAFNENEIRQYYNNYYFRSKSYSDYCLSPWIVAYIFPDGSVKPCLNLDYVFGNVKEENFISIWNNEKAIKFRQRLKEIKHYPACPRCTEFYRY